MEIVQWKYAKMVKGIQKKYPLKLVLESQGYSYQKVSCWKNL